MRRMTSTGTVAAPVTESRSVERSKVSRSGCSRIDWNTVGGPGQHADPLLGDPLA